MSADTAKVDVYMPWFVSDYLMDTADLDVQEHGAYSLLLMHMWKRGGRLPLDHDRLARLCRVGADRWASIWDVIGHYFTEEDGCISQKRLSAELDRARKKKTDARDSGRKGASGRWGKPAPAQHDGDPIGETMATPLADPMAKPWRNDGSSSSSSESESPPDPPSDPERADPPQDPRARAIPDDGSMAITARSWRGQDGDTVHHQVVRVRPAGLPPNPAHTGALTDGGLDPSPPARDPPEHRAMRLVALFGRIGNELARARGQPEVTLHLDPSCHEKAEAFVRQVAGDRAACLAVEPTMRLRLQDAWDSQHPKDIDPGWVFATWISRFEALRARVDGRVRGSACPGLTDRDRENLANGQLWLRMKQEQEREARR